MLHTVATDVVQPSSVHHAISGRFRGPSQSDLLVVRHNVLQLYEVASNGGAHKYISETRLNAPPVSVTTLTSPAGSGLVDRLVILVSDLHVSVCKFHLATRSFVAESLFQLDDAAEIPIAATTVPPILRVDPMSRVILVISRRKYMFLIPVTFPGGKGDAVLSAGADAVLASKEEKEADWGDEDDATASSNVAVPTEPAAATITPVTHQADISGDFDDGDEEEGRAVEFGPVRLVIIPLALKSSLRNIRDVQFVPSGSDPTVAFLCEATPTWAGRVKLIEWRTGTVHSHELSCAVAWFSIDLRQRVGATAGAFHSGSGFLFLGEVDSIPYNATSLVPFSSPADAAPAVLCLASNTILHVSSKRVTGFFLNVHGKEEGANTTGSAWRKVSWTQQNKLTRRGLAARLNMNCAGAVAVPLTAQGQTSSSKRLLICTEVGHVFSCAAESDGRVLHELSLSYIGQTSPVSCGITLIPTASTGANGVIFLGSACGDSHSFQFNPTSLGDLFSNPPLHVLKCLGPILDAEVVDTTTLDTELISAAAASGGWSADGSSAPPSPYDELLRDLKLAPSPPAEFLDSALMDLLLCSGKDHTGALHVCRQSVRPRVVLRQALDSISVFFLDSGRKRPLQKSDEGDANSNSHGGNAGVVGVPTLLVATATSSIVVTIGQRMTQVRPEDTKLLTTQRTIYATASHELTPSAAGSSSILQVTEHGVVQLLRADHRLVFARTDILGTPVRFATHDPLTRHVLVLTSDHTLHAVYLAPPNDNTFRKLEVLKNVAAVTPVPAVAGAAPLLAVVLQCGSLQLLQWSGDVYTVVGKVTRFSTFPSRVKLATSTTPDAPTSIAAAPEPKNLSAKLAAEPLPQVTEILAVRLSKNDVHVGSIEDSYVTLFCLCNGEVVVYSVTFSAVTPSAALRLCFFKLSTTLIDIELKVEKKESIEEKQRRLLEQNRHTVQDTTALFYAKCRHLVKFTDVGGLDGVFVCGKRPRIFITAGDKSVSHPVQSGTVRGFSELNGPLMPSGFVACGEGSLSFATIDATFDYSMAWLTKRIRLGGTPHGVVYSHAAHSVFVSVSEPAPYRPRKAPFDVEMRVTWNEDGTSTSEILPQPEFQPVNEAQGRPIPMNDRYSVVLVSVADWTSSDKLLLDENEQVLCSQSVDINASAVVRGEPMPETAQVCAVGTGYPLGEDTPCRGRLLILTSTIVSGSRRIRIVAKDEAKGPVTALASLRSHVVAAVGATIKLYRIDWDTNRLVVSAFLYAGVYVPRLTVIKNYLVFGDIVHSCCLVRFCEKELSLQRLAKHPAEFSVLHVDTLYRDHDFGIVATDAERRLVILGYAPRIASTDQSDTAAGPDAQQGKLLESTLTVDAELRVPSGSISKTLRLASPSGRYPTLLYVTTAGAIGFLASVSEHDNHTMNWISQKLVQQLPHHAGLSPKAFLSCQSELATPREALVAKEKVADGALLNRFADLGWTHRAQLAMTAGTRAPHVMNVLLGLQHDTSIF